MNVRDTEDADIAILREIHARANYGFSFPERDGAEEFLTLVDDAGCPIMGASVKMVPEVTLLCAPGGSTHPLVKLKGIALIHDALRVRLVGKGHATAIASVPPKIVASYGRHLQRHFGWKESWTTFRICDWKGGT